MPLSKFTSAISTVFGERHFINKRIIDILAHAMIRHFFSLYWDWYLQEKEAFEGQAVDNGTVGDRHPDQGIMVSEQSITEPFPALS